MLCNLYAHDILDNYFLLTRAANGTAAAGLTWVWQVGGIFNASVHLSQAMKLAKMFEMSTRISNYSSTDITEFGFIHILTIHVYEFPTLQITVLVLPNNLN